MKSKGEQYMNQLQTVSQASDKYTQTASLQNSAAKSLSMGYQDLARRLYNSGAVVDIKNANQALEKGMSSHETAKLISDANHEINNSSAKHLGVGSNERDALVEFLKLNQQDPTAAAAVLNKHLTPTSSDSGVTLSPTQFQVGSQSVNVMVSSKTADGFRAKAQSGAGDGVDRDDFGKENFASPSSQHAVADSNNAGDNIVKPSQTLSHTSSAEVTAALSQDRLGGNPDQVRHQIESGGKLPAGKIDGADLGINAAGNFGNAGHDITRETANAATHAVDAVQGDLSTYAKQSVDNFKDDLGLNKKNSVSDKPNIPSDNDLPPIPKK
jgi:hypothetical protein